MDLAELRGAGALRRPRRRAAGRAARRGRPRSPSAGARCSSTRASRPTSGGCCSRARSSWCGRSAPRSRCSGYMTGPASGPAGSPRGTSRRLPRDRPRREPRPGAAGAAPELRRLSEQWFPFGVHLIEGLVHTVRSIESTARQREALVALGTLAAGLAHEINNPASAATRAVDALQGTCEHVLVVAGPARRRGHHGRAVHRPRRAAARVSGPEPALAALGAGRPRGRARRTGSADHDVDRDWVIAPALAAAGVDVAWCDELAAALPHGALAPALEWVAARCRPAALLRRGQGGDRRGSPSWSPR